MIKPKWLRELRELLRSEAFTAWYGRFTELTRAVAAGRERLDDLLAQSNPPSFRAELTQRAADDCVFRAGECEDLSVSAASEYAELENDSFQLLDAYEGQRVRATEAWLELDRCENRLEESRARASELRARAEAARRAGKTEAMAEALRLEERLRELEASIEQLGRQYNDMQAQLQAEEERKQQLWSEEEQSWSSAFRAQLARSEYAYQARRERARAEELYARASEERVRGEALEAEAQGPAKSPDVRAQLEALAKAQEKSNGENDKLLRAHLQSAGELFGCALIEDFLYWPKQDDMREAFCVPLIAEDRHFNIQVAPLMVYQIDQSRGVEFLEPVVEEAGKENEDPRLSAFFTRAQGPALSRVEGRNLSTEAAASDAVTEKVHGR